MPRLITEWSTDDPGLARTLQRLEAMPEHTPERWEGMAMLHLTEARTAWREADRLRELTARRGRHPRGHCPACGRELSIDSERRVRPHGAPSTELAMPNYPSRCLGSRQPATEESSLV